MTHSDFFPPPKALSVAELVSLTGAVALFGGEASQKTFSSVAPIEAATAHDVSFLDNVKYQQVARSTRAGLCFCQDKFKDIFPETTLVLITPHPYDAYARVAAQLFPDALRPQTVLETGISPYARIAPTAKLGENVTVEAGAIIGDYAQIGKECTIGPNAVVGAHVTVGMKSSIAANVTLQHCHLGDRVIVHPGAAIGQDGFGFVMSPMGHSKVVQVGRVIIQNDVEIGANCTIDRGANRDTIIGEGTKIDNQVQIAHNVQIGRHCVIAAQVGIAGSTTIGDFVAIGGQSGVIGHVEIGDGAQIAASSAVKDPMPAGARWGGTPAKPLRELARELATLSKISKKDK